MALLEILSWVAVGAFLGLFRSVSSSPALMQRSVPLSIMGGMVGGMIGYLVDWQISLGSYSASALMFAAAGAVVALTLHWISTGA